ncbi:MAG: RNA polymerase sigma factor [Aquisalimonadaceae bacterium]
MSTVVRFWHHLRPNAAFERCVRPHVPRLYRLAWRLTGSQEDAEDLIQETLLRAYPKRDQVLELDAPGPWLARVLHNTWVDRWRRKGVMRDAYSLDDPDSPLPEASTSDEPLLVAVESAALEQALATLPEPQRVVVLMHDAEGYTLEEISRILDVPVGTLKSRLHRAREALRARIAAGTFSSAAACQGMR